MSRVLDTNAVLYLLGGKLAETLPSDEYFISVISEMELLSYPNLDDPELSQIKSFLADVSVVDLTPGIRELAIRLRRQHTLKLPDAIVAATALSLQAKLVTNDAKLLHVRGLTYERLELKKE